MKNPWILPTEKIISMQDVIKEYCQEYKIRATGITYDTKLIHEYRLHIVFEGELVKFIVICDDINNTYVIKSIHKDVGEPICVEDDNKITIESAESSIQYGCKISIRNETIIENISKQPTQNISTGKFALGLGFAICTSLGKTPKLVDVSTISCSPDVYFSLTRFKLLTTGKTWYESFIARRGTKKRLHLRSRDAITEKQFEHALTAISTIPMGKFVQFAKAVKENLEPVGFFGKANMDGLLVYNSPGYVSWLMSSSESSFWNSVEKQAYIKKLTAIVEEFSTTEKRTIKSILRNASCTTIYNITEVLFDCVLGIHTKSGEIIVMPEYKYVAKLHHLLTDTETVMIIKERKTRKRHM